MITLVKGSKFNRLF